MYYLVLFIVLSAISSISLVTKFVKQQIAEDLPEKGVIKEWQIYVISLLGGSIGNLILLFTLKELQDYNKRNHQRYLLINLGCLAIDIIIIYILFHFKVLKF